MTKWYHIQSKWTGPATNFSVSVLAVANLAPCTVNLCIPNETIEGWVDESTLEHITQYVRLFRDYKTGCLTTFVLESTD